MMAEYGAQSITAIDIELLVRRFSRGARDGRVDINNFRESMTPVLPV